MTLSNVPLGSWNDVIYSDLLASENVCTLADIISLVGNNQGLELHPTRMQQPHCTYIHKSYSKIPCFLADCYGMDWKHRH